MEREWHLVIGGERREGRGDTATVLEPATGKPLAEVAQASSEDLEDALAGAVREFEGGEWARTSATERGQVLLPVAALLRERGDDLAVTEARGAGHPMADARWEAATAAEVFEYYAGAACRRAPY